MLDTRRGIETPEGVMFELRPAGPVARFGACFIDLLIRQMVYLVMLMILAPAGGLGMGILLILIFLIEWFYPVVFEVLRDGATPGKKVMNITVVEDSGLPVGVHASVIRNLLRFVDFLPFLYGFAVVSMLLTRDFKRLGDLAAGTQVVYRDPPAAAAKLPDVLPVALDRLPTSPVQLAMIALAERSARITSERFDELTELAEEAAQLRPVQDRRARMLGAAQWLLGRR